MLNVHFIFKRPTGMSRSSYMLRDPLRLCLITSIPLLTIGDTYYQGFRRRNVSPYVTLAADRLRESEILGSV